VGGAITQLCISRPKASQSPSVARLISQCIPSPAVSGVCPFVSVRLVVACLTMTRRSTRRDPDVGTRSIDTTRYVVCLVISIHGAALGGQWCCEGLWLFRPRDLAFCGHTVSPKWPLSRMGSGFRDYSVFVGRRRCSAKKVRIGQSFAANRSLTGTEMLQEALKCDGNALTKQV
jgi:hypothetical protein